MAALKRIELMLLIKLFDISCCLPLLFVKHIIIYINQWLQCQVEKAKKFKPGFFTIYSKQKILLIEPDK